LGTQIGHMTHLKKWSFFHQTPTICCLLIARNVRELFSSNRGVSYFNEARCIDELSRGSDLGYKILTGFGFGVPWVEAS
jgi:hypothetical protein